MVRVAKMEEKGSDVNIAPYMSPTRSATTATG